MLKTEIINVHPEHPEPEIIEKAAELLRHGDLVVYPTESAYALGGNAFDENAVRKVFEAKKRSFGIPLPIIVSDLEMWKTCAFVDARAERLIDRFLPGPLTIALKKKPIITDILNPQTIAARISSHPVALALVKRARVPITATSANISGNSSHYTVKQVMRDLDDKTNLVLDAGRLPRRQLSTVVDFTFGSTPKITRLGAISEKAISEVISVEVVAQ